MFVFCTLGMAAQDGIQVMFGGTQPNIYDFAWDLRCLVMERQDS